MIFIIKYILFYCSIMFTMCIDNICWIPDSPEWTNIRKNFLVFTLFREFGIPKNKLGLKYVWNDRIKTVLTHPRDILPAIITAGVLTLIW